MAPTRALKDNHAKGKAAAVVSTQQGGFLSRLGTESSRPAMPSSTPDFGLGPSTPKKTLPDSKKASPFTEALSKVNTASNRAISTMPGLFSPPEPAKAKDLLHRGLENIPSHRQRFEPPKSNVPLFGNTPLFGSGSLGGRWTPSDDSFRFGEGLFNDQANLPPDDNIFDLMHRQEENSRGHPNLPPKGNIFNRILSSQEFSQGHPKGNLYNLVSDSQENSRGHPKSIFEDNHGLFEPGNTTTGENTQTGRPLFGGTSSGGFNPITSSYLGVSPVLDPDSYAEYLQIKKKHTAMSQGAAKATESIKTFEVLFEWLGNAGIDDDGLGRLQGCLKYLHDEAKLFIDGIDQVAESNYALKTDIWIKQRRCERVLKQVKTLEEQSDVDAEEFKEKQQEHSQILEQISAATDKQKKKDEETTRLEVAFQKGVLIPLCWQQNSRKSLEIALARAKTELERSKASHQIVESLLQDNERKHTELKAKVEDILWDAETSEDRLQEKAVEQETENTKKFERLNKELEKERDKHNRLRKQIEKDKAQLSAEKATVRREKEEATRQLQLYKTTTTERAELFQELTKRQGEIAQLENVIKNLEERFKTGEVAKQEAVAARKNFELAYNQTVAEVDSLTIEDADHKEEIAQLQGQLQAERESREVLQQKLEALEANGGAKRPPSPRPTGPVIVRPQDAMVDKNHLRSQIEHKRNQIVAAKEKLAKTNDELATTKDKVADTKKEDQDPDELDNQPAVSAATGQHHLHQHTDGPGGNSASPARLLQPVFTATLPIRQPEPPPRIRKRSSDEAMASNVLSFPSLPAPSQSSKKQKVQPLHKAPATALTRNLPTYATAAVKGARRPQHSNLPATNRRANAIAPNQGSGRPQQTTNFMFPLTGVERATHGKGKEAHEGFARDRKDLYNAQNN
ncbi:hypothetical protein BDV95DRAFT_352727 [Massariosphaeria phaeospora]|uniref:Uncharacterized protein n=1 Tax=Massariosphaeria phaeospora TaxID=100035 RepID=A0A7C8I940_9PLEO|nr:hypothetical protein BDV95DRAFT_352727 [Massariosphaeria phaeospora]